jgi:hypothetical protein
MKKAVYTMEQIQNITMRLDELIAPGIENSKRIGVIATILENPEQIIGDSEEGEKNEHNEPKTE